MLPTSSPVQADKPSTISPYIRYAPHIICALAALVSIVALLTIGGNELTKLIQNGGDLKEGIVQGLWATAKWSAVVAGGSLMIALGTEGVLYLLKKEEKEPKKIE